MIKKIEDLGVKELVELSDKNWEWVSEKERLSECFIRKYFDFLDVVRICIFQDLSESFIHDFRDRLVWRLICKHQKMSEVFMNEHLDYLTDLYMKEVCKYQELSECFIRKNIKHIDWKMIAEYQDLEEAFIEEFQKSLDMKTVSEFQYLSEEFRNKHSLAVSNDNWLYKDINYKRAVIVNTRLYDCHEDYFIAYKAIWPNRYSTHKFHFQFREFIVGNTYECKADFTNKEYSFGLSVSTKRREELFRKVTNASDVIKVKIYYKDVAGVFPNYYDDGSIRCKKLTVLS